MRGLESPDPPAAPPGAGQPPRAGLAPAGRVIVNPLSGERIVIHQAAPAGGVLAWEMVLMPGGRVPARHRHPEQEERFTVLAGALRFRLGWRRFTLRPGETVLVQPGRVHHFTNPGSVPARVAVATAPALAMAELLETAAALAREQHAAGRRLPRPAELLLFMRDFEREVQAPYLPAGLARLAVRAGARLAGRLGRDHRYRQVRNGRGYLAG